MLGDADTTGAVGRPRPGAGHDEPAPPRAAAVALRQVAEQILLLLGPVIALDDDLTWRSPWQQRCHARIDAWASALAAGARLARERADVLDLAATAGQATTGHATAGHAAVPVPPGRLVVRQPERLRSTGPPGPVDVRFSVERLAELAHRLRAAGHEAVRLLARLGPTGRAVGVCHGLDLVAAQAGEMAEAIDRRLTEIAAAESLARRPVPSPDQAWRPADRPAPRLAAPRLAARGSAAPEGLAAGLAMLIGTDPLRLGVAELAEISVRLARLAPGELTSVIGGLRGRPLEVLAAAVALAPSRLDLSTLRRLPAVVALGDLILRQAPASMVGEVARLFPGLEPPVVEQGPSWIRALGPSASTGGFVRRGHGRSPVWVRGATAADVGQGRLGDCYFLAALLGVVHADPGLLREHLRENANGTVTVTLYTGHGPRAASGAGSAGRGAVEITVTRSLPVDRRTGQEIGADTDNADGDPELWPALYEKAYARLAGSYAGIEGGDPAAAMRQLTGAEAVGVPAADVEVPDIAGRLAAGDVVTVVTRNRPGNGSTLVPAHAYTILGADEHTGRVLLRNPWDQTASDDRLDWHSWEEIRAELAGVQCGSTRRRS